ncbi:TerD family protein, partial [Streptomyces sp. Ru87]
MTAELVRGQNHPLPGTRLEIRISAGVPVVAGATLADERGRVTGADAVAHPASPSLPGIEVSRQAAADHRLAVDLQALAPAVHQVTVLLALPDRTGGPTRFGGLPAPFVSVTSLDGTEIAGYTVTGLDSESAVTALELYRRQGAWKVRAVGQGYAGGLADMLGDQGLPQAAELAATVQDTVARGMARSMTPPPRPGNGGGRVRTAGPGPGGTGAPAAGTGLPQGGPAAPDAAAAGVPAPGVPAPAAGGSGGPGGSAPDAAAPPPGGR